MEQTKHQCMIAVSSGYVRSNEQSVEREAMSIATEMNREQLAALGKQRLLQANFQEAKALFEQALAAKPDDGELYAWLAACYGRMMETANVLHKMRMLPKFKELVEQSLRLSPNDAFARRLNGMRLLNTPVEFGGDVAKALSELLFAIDGGEQDSEMYDGLGQAYLKLGETEKGKQSLERALSIDPDNIQARKRLKLLQQPPSE